MNNPSKTSNVIIPIIRNVLPGMVAQSITGVQPMMSGSGGKSIFYNSSLWASLQAKSYNRKYWPYQFSLDRGQLSAAERWCWRNFKGRYWSSSGRLFVFKRSEDATLFAITWGSTRYEA